MAAPPPSASEALTPPQDQVARFRRDLETLTDTAPTPVDRLGVAVSGGPDSIALLLLAAAAYPDAVRAVTVDHGTRAEAVAEAAAVATLCARLNVPHATLAPQAEPGATGSAQERARTLRYAALAAWAATERLRWVAVAHQRNDVAESFLMRARRGAGVGGLAAMPARRALGAGDDGPVLLRPLLSWSREELAAVPQCLGVAVSTDPSNADPRHDRSRMRALIAASDELVASRLALSAQNLRHAEAALEWAEARELPARFGVEGSQATVDARDLPYELQRRLARRAIARVRIAGGNPEPWHEQGLDRLVATLIAGGTGTLADVKAVARGGVWRFEPAPPRRS